MFFSKLFPGKFSLSSKQDLVEQAAYERNKHRIILNFRTNHRWLITLSVAVYHQILKPMAEFVALLLFLTAYTMLMGGSIVLLIRIAYEELIGRTALRMQQKKSRTQDSDKDIIPLIIVFSICTLAFTVFLKLASDFIKSQILNAGDYLLWYPNYIPLDNRRYTDKYIRLFDALKMDDVAMTIRLTQPNFSRHTSIAIFKNYRGHTITLHRLASELAAFETIRLLEKIDEGTADQRLAKYLQDQSIQSAETTGPKLEWLYPAWGLRKTLSDEDRRFLEKIRNNIPAISIPVRKKLSFNS